MPRNSFTLNNNLDKLGVFGPATINGSDGDQTALIFGSATDVVLTATMERADFALASSDVTFSYNPASLQIEVRQGTNLIASIANNAVSGTNLAFTDGGVNVKLGSNAAGDLVLQVQGDAGSAPQEIALDGSVHPLEVPADSTITSEVGGGDTPTPPTPTVTEVDLDNGGTIPADGSAYILVGAVATINGQTYTDIKNATSIVVKDTADNLIADDGTVAPAASALIADAKVTEVRVSDSLAELALTPIPDFGKTTKLVVTGTVPADGTINLPAGDALTVAGVTGAQAQLDAFLARTDVTWPEGVTPPTALSLGTYAIADTAANVAAADTAVLTGATSVAIDDTVAGIKAATIGSLSGITNLSIEVSDTLANLGSLTSTELTVIKGADSSAKFIATDKGDATTHAVSADASALAGFQGNEISFEDATITTVNLTASKALGTADTAFEVDKLFDSANTLTTINVTGSTSADNITASSKGGIIDGNGGADTITLGSGVDTVVLGTGVDLEGDSSVFTTVKTFTSTSDKIAFATSDTFLKSLDLTKAADVTGGVSGSENAVALTMNTVNVEAGTNVGTSVTDVAGVRALFVASGAQGGYEFLAEGAECILVLETSSATNIWYLKGGNNESSADDDTIVLLGAVTDTAGSTAGTVTKDDFAALGA